MARWSRSHKPPTTSTCPLRPCTGGCARGSSPASRSPPARHGRSGSPPSSAPASASTPPMAGCRSPRPPARAKLASGSQAPRKRRPRGRPRQQTIFICPRPAARPAQLARIVSRERRVRLLRGPRAQAVQRRQAPTRHRQRVREAQRLVWPVARPEPDGHPQARADPHSGRPRRPDPEDGPRPGCEG